MKKKYFGDKKLYSLKIKTNILKLDKAIKVSITEIIQQKKLKQQ